MSLEPCGDTDPHPTILTLTQSIPHLEPEVTQSTATLRLTAVAPEDGGQPVHERNSHVLPDTDRRALAFAAAIVAFGIASLVTYAVVGPGTGQERCSDDVPKAWSVARLWNEATLDAIRRDLPAPTVHSRNLYHASAAMWDAWAAYDPEATGVFVDEQVSAPNTARARDEAISYAAYRVLEARYIEANGASDTIPQLDRLMEALCFPVDFVSTEGNSPAALGNRIAASILRMTIDDGAHESDGYSVDTYEPANPPLRVADPGTVLVDPNRWQPLQLAFMISQNGIPLEDGVQEFIGPHWGFVTPFALAPDPVDGVPLDPGSPPYHGSESSDSDYKASAVEVIRYSSLLDPRSGTTVDISPAALGGNRLGTNDGSGHDTNPVTGAPYQPNLVSQGDFGRVVAEFWADGPASETPPGHWNTIANSVSDALDGNLRVGGQGDVVDRLQWDVMMYLALNGANHDAAIAAWGAKGYYDYIRPISMIRWMGGLGQSSDDTLPSYNEGGLPLVDDLIAVITEETAASGGIHEQLSEFVGDIAIRAYTGTPVDQEGGIGGVDWIRAVEWVPYQAPTFVTPSFAAYVSGHSTFSRASAEVLAALTGSEFFPGGLGEWTILAGDLDFEAGPRTDVTLQWATFADAADQAGLSRLYGGIHVRADDFMGRRMGSAVGKTAWAEALSHFGQLGA